MTMSAAIHVLVVEDNSALANVLKFNLERFNYEVTVAANGREAWELLRNRGFDVIVADHQMPEVSGLELCERARNDARLREVPFILVTAKRLELDVERLRERLNICRIFAKPFSPAAIIDAVGDQLSAAR